MDEFRRHQQRPTENGFWRSRTFLVVAVFLAVGGLLLVFEHRAHVFTSNGLLVGLLVACIAMHFLMHGGHGGRGGDGGRK